VNRPVLWWKQAIIVLGITGLCQETLIPALADENDAVITTPRPITSAAAKRRVHILTKATRNRLDRASSWPVGNL
jgi:hypothetical protein